MFCFAGKLSLSTEQILHLARSLSGIKHVCSVNGKVSLLTSSFILLGYLKNHNRFAEAAVVLVDYANVSLFI